jgi:hypothetical protein
MGSAPDVYASLKKELGGNGSGAQVILSGDGEVYEQSIKRWSEHCVKRAVRLPPHSSAPFAFIRLIYTDNSHSRPVLSSPPPRPMSPQSSPSSATTRSLS